MASRLNVIWGFIAHYKYLITFVIGFLVVGVLDDNSFRKRIQYELQISDLENQIEKYQKQYQVDSKQLMELRRSPKAIQKIARERYFMKADNEDIYVFSSDVQKANEEKEKQENNEATD